MDDKFWRDYRLERPGTLGGEVRRSEQSLAQPFPSPAQSAHPSVDDPVAIPRAPRVPYRFKRTDFAVAIVVFLATWLVLWRSSNMGGETAAAAGFFASCLAARWWRQLLVVLVVALGLAIYFHSR
jgi:hypothetical protein